MSDPFVPSNLPEPAMDVPGIPPEGIPPPPLPVNEEATDKDAEEIENNLKSIISQLLSQDQPQRDIEIAEAKEHLLYWKGIQKAIWSEIAHDWQTPDLLPSEDLGDIDDSTLSRVINIVKAFGESFIASLSSGLPKTRFFPDDADNPEDISTARGSSKVTALIEKQNNAEMKLMKMLWTWYNDGLIAVYNFHKEDEKFGIGQKPVLQQAEMTSNQLSCASCESPLGDAEEGEDVSSTTPGMPPAPIECPTCGVAAPPNVSPVTEMVPVLGFESYPKSREIFNVYGILHVRIPPYAAEFEDAAYIRLEFEQNVAFLKHLFSEKRDKIVGTTSGQESEGRWARLSEQGTGNSQLATVGVIWLREWAFEVLEDKEKVDRLKKLYPNGCKVTQVADEVVEHIEEDIDDHWTLTESPTSLFIKDTAPVSSLISIQDIRNDLTDLEIKNIEQSIPETFVDQDLLDSDEYNKVTKTPGLVFPVKAQGGKPIADHFHTLSTATLSKEAEVLLQRLDQDSRFVMGIYPAIYGGPQGEGSKTLGEYEMSRNQALQRLSIAWKIINNLWPRMMKKCVMSFIHNMQGDEKTVERQGNTFANVWIKKAELNGKIGEVESETNEQFPASWSQKRGMLLELLNLHNPQFDATINDPHNISLIHDTVGFSELFVPGEDDRNKQLNEITELLKGQPLPPQVDPFTGMPAIDPMTGRPAPPTSSVPIQYELDNHPIEAKACRDFLISEAGQSIKGTPGYENIYLHMMEHLAAMRQLAPPEPAPEEIPSGKKPSGNGKIPDIAEPPNPPADTSAGTTVQ